jgi:hypothetical protein
MVCDDMLDLETARRVGGKPDRLDAALLLDEVGEPCEQTSHLVPISAVKRALDAIDFAQAAIDEAEYAALDALYAKAEADSPVS